MNANGLKLADGLSQLWASYIKTLQIYFIFLSDWDALFIWSPNLARVYSPKWGYKDLSLDHMEIPLPLVGKIFVEA